jgi:hypothetical protein
MIGKEYLSSSPYVGDFVLKYLHYEERKTVSDKSKKLKFHNTSHFAEVKNPTKVFFVAFLKPHEDRFRREVPMAELEFDQDEDMDIASLTFLSPEQVQMIDEALKVLGEYGELRLIVEKGRLRFLVTQKSIDALKWRPGLLENGLK